MSAALVAIISLFTGAIGALVVHVLAERKSRNDELSRLRLEAYVDFIRCSSHLVSARRSGLIHDEIEDLGAINDAKVRIYICGDAPVIEALEKFWLLGGTLEREQEILAFTELCRRMRASLGRDQPRLQGHLSDILFKLEPSNYSYALHGESNIDAKQA